MKFKLNEAVWFDGYKWVVVEVFDSSHVPVPSSVTLRLSSKPWYLIFANLPHEIVVGEKRWPLITRFRG